MLHIKVLGFTDRAAGCYLPELGSHGDTFLRTILKFKVDNKGLLIWKNRINKFVVVCLVGFDMHLLKNAAMCWCYGDTT